MIALLLDPVCQPCDAGPGPGMDSMRGSLLASLSVDTARRGKPAILQRGLVSGEVGWPQSRWIIDYVP